ncbi:hypothetical protein ACFL2U_03600 [Patescibacteria group bacterium]
MKIKKRMKMQATVVLVIMGVMLVAVMALPLFTNQGENTKWTPPSNVTLNTGGELDSGITNVQFYVNEDLTSDTSQPYTFYSGNGKIWVPHITDDYDSAGSKTTSQTHTFTVYSSPLSKLEDLATQHTNDSLEAPTDTQTSHCVEAYSIQGELLSKPCPTAEKTTSSVQELPTANHEEPPTVSLTCCYDGPKFNAPANITLDHHETNDNGVANVEFYLNGVLVE